MPRKFHTRKHKKTTKRRLHRKGRRGGHSDTMMFKLSKSTHDPLPARYFTWLTIDQTGYVAAGNATNNFLIGLNNIIHPFSQGGSSITNPVPAVATNDPTGLQNLLYNSVTGTGIWKRFRVWGAKVNTSIMPRSVLDSVNAAQVATTLGTAYASIFPVMQAPHSSYKVISSGTYARGNTFSRYYSIPKIMGIPKREYAAETANTYGTYATAPSDGCNIQVLVETLDAQNLTVNLGYNVRIQYFVEFFNLVDTLLLVA